MKDLLQAVYKHYTLDESEGIATYYEGQAKPTDVSIHRCEIHLFGPFTNYIGRDGYMGWKVYLYLTLKIGSGIYNWADYVDKYIAQARKPLTFQDEEGEFIDCVALDRIKTVYRGAIEFLEYCQIEIEYQKEI
jgi:hypothetical protein